MAKIEGEVTIKVSNAEELRELNSNIKKAIQLNGVLRDIQATKLAISTEDGEGEIAIKVSNAEEFRELNSNIKKAIQLNGVLRDIQATELAISTEDGDDTYKENSVATSIINQLNNYDLGYSNWVHIISTVERSYSPYPITIDKKDGV